MTDFVAFFNSFWSELSSRWQPTPNTLTDNLGVLLLLLVVALALAVVPQVWRWTSYFITVIHEGGHSLAAILVGSRIHGIKIRWDRSGETQTVGSSFLPFRMWITWWGYPFPAVLGAVYIWGAKEGWQGVAITLTLVIMFVMFLQIRSLIAFLSITLALVGTWAAWWYLPSPLLALLLYTIGWFLIFGGIQGLLNLTKLHATGSSEGSDALALQRMTLLIPAMGWLGTFWLATLFALAFVLKIFFIG